MTTTEVAEVLRTSAETVRYWRHVGKGPKSFKAGRRVLYAREDVEAFLATARAQPPSQAQIEPPHVRFDRPAPAAAPTISSFPCPNCGVRLDVKSG